MNKKKFNKRKNFNNSKQLTKTGSTEKDIPPAKGKNTNDPDWYSINSELAKQIATIPFSQFIGTSYELMSTRNSPSGITGIKNTGQTKGILPSVLIANYIPWYGEAWQSSDALSMTTRAFYQYIRHANSGAKNYEAPDLMMYIMAMDNIYLAVAEIKRVLRLANTYFLKNRDIPDQIIMGLGIDVSDLRHNYISYVARLNIMIARINTMAVPEAFKLFNRRAVMGTTILTDDVDAPTQITLYNARWWYEYNFIEPSASDSSTLEGVQKNLLYTPEQTDYVTAKLCPLTYWLDTLEQLIEKVIEDEDMNIMSGDILKAYGDNLHKLSYLASDETQPFIYDVNLLQQFKNTIFLDTAVGACGPLQFVTRAGSNAIETFSKSPMIAQSKGILNARVRLAGTATNRNWTTVTIGGMMESLRVNLPITCVHEPSPEELLEWSRNMMTVDSKSLIITAGTEIFTDLCLVVPKQQQENNSLYNGIALYQIHQHPNARGFNKLVPGDINIDAGYIKYMTECAPNSSGIRGIGFTNNYWAMATVLGLDYGPNIYPYYNDDNTNKTWNSELSVDASPVFGNVKTHNGLVSKTNIKMWHDYALAALLFNSYIKN